MKYLSHYLESAQSEALSLNGAFYAFGEGQFKEASKDGVLYVHLKHGLICPKANVENLVKQLGEAFEEGIKADVAENGVYAIIQREYFNHEAQIAGEQEAYDSLAPYQTRYPELFSDNAIVEAFKHCYQLAIKQDLF
jgi:hypothetical protein